MKRRWNALLRRADKCTPSWDLFVRCKKCGSKGGLLWLAFHLHER